MEEQKQTLIKKAQQKYGKIKPCGLRTSFENCFTETQGKLLFWFNDHENSTKIEHIEVIEPLS